MRDLHIVSNALQGIFTRSRLLRRLLHVHLLINISVKVKIRI